MRTYERMIDDIPTGCSIGKSPKAREFANAMRGSQQSLCEHRVREICRLVVLKTDGPQVPGKCVVVHFRVDERGRKQVLGPVRRLSLHLV